MTQSSGLPRRRKAKSQPAAGLATSQVPGATELSTMRIALRPYRLSDIHDLVAAANHPDINRYLRDHFPYPYTIQDAYWWLTEGVKSAATHAAITLDGICIGGVSVVYGQAEAQLSGEIGYWLGRDYWGRGFATDAVRQMTREVFDTTDLVRIYAQVFAPNMASRRVLESCGYQLEGVLRQAVLKDNQLLDMHIYARLRDEP